MGKNAVGTTSSEELSELTLLQGSDGEHRLQEKYDSRNRAINFYEKQMLDYLSPKMIEFIESQEFLFVATADRHGECDNTPKFGKPGFIRVLGNKYVLYPEFRGNGVYANSGNLSENPHIAMLIIDFTRDTVGLHVNGRARVIENDEMLTFANKLPQSVLDDINQEGKKQPERWVMVEVEEAYIQCSKHIPLMSKANKVIEWGTDSIVAKGGDYFQLQGLPLYDRVGGDAAMEIAVELFHRKVQADDLVSRFFKDIDMDRQRIEQKKFLTMAFGGSDQFNSQDLLLARSYLVEKMGLTHEHFDHFLKLFSETLQELSVSEKEQEGMLAILESARDDLFGH